MKTIDTLKQIQKMKQLSDAKFAAKFGVHRTTWIRIKTGQIKSPVSFLAKVEKVYPGLKEQAWKDIHSVLKQQAKNKKEDKKLIE